MEGITPEALEAIKEKINEIINKSPDIDEREEEIIRLRFGLDEKGPIKIKDLSKKFDIPPRKMKKEIDAIEKKIFNKLKRTI
jgi:RNA polymerase primary sigma factor